MKKNLHIIIISVFFSIVLWGFISLSEEYYSTISVPIKLTNFPGGYTSGTNIPKNISIRIKGEGWKLINVNLGSNPEFKVPVGNETGKRSINLFNYLANNQWLSSDLEVIDLSPDTISFSVEKIGQTRVKIIPDLNINFKAGYGLATPVKIVPDSTTVYGPVSDIRNMNSIKTEELALNDLDTKISRRIPLQSKAGMNYQYEAATVTLNVQKIVDKTFDDLKVQVLDVPRDRDVVLLPNKISIGVRGGIEILGKLEPEDFNVYIYYRDVVLDTLGSIPPRLELPNNTSLLYSKPERLRYIIKKFN